MKGGKFVTSTLEVLEALSRMGVAPLNGLASRGDGTAVETFPTLFMATFLPPEPYTGKRSEHSDDLWTRLVTATRRSSASPLIAYLPLMVEVEAASRCDLHDLRAAAVCAIAADLWGGTDLPATFIGTVEEGGFLLPPVVWWDVQFRVLVEGHLGRRRNDLGLRCQEIEGHNGRTKPR
jgi:hypothetical protein